MKFVILILSLFLFSLSSHSQENTKNNVEFTSDSLEVDEKKCICCGACFPPCPPMQINDAEHTKLSVWVGGNHSNARGKPSFQKLVAAGIPNNPPRIPTNKPRII